MPKTISCPQCGIVLNMPESAAGKRLKCPKCETRFVASEAEAKAASRISPHDAGLASVIEPGPDQSRSGLEREPDLPTAPGDLRETFDLSMMTGAADSGPAQAADAMALFQDQKPEARRPGAAEARAKPRRCPTCGGYVPAGMSLCSTCGFDLETGTRTDLTDDLVPDTPVRSSETPLAIAILGGICALGSLILLVASLIQWSRGLQGAQLLSVVCLFGIYASVQFLRRKSIKLLLVALSLGAMIDIVALIALPLYLASNVDVMAVQTAPDAVEPGMADVLIPSFAQRLEASGGAEKIELGIGILFLYAAVMVYLVSPMMHRQFYQ